MRVIEAPRDEQRGCVLSLMSWEGAKEGLAPFQKRAGFWLLLTRSSFLLHHLS